MSSTNFTAQLIDLPKALHVRIDGVTIELSQHGVTAVITVPFLSGPKYGCVHWQVNPKLWMIGG